MFIISRDNFTFENINEFTDKINILRAVSLVRAFGLTIQLLPLDIQKYY